MAEIIIIGAGPAGLTAAYTILKNSALTPIVLEASSSIGGISRTIRHGQYSMDLGGHRFFTKNPEVMALWKQIMPLQGAPAIDDIILDRPVPLEKNGPDPEQTDQVMLVRRRISRIYFSRKFFDYPISLKRETFTNMGFRRTVAAGLGMVCSSVYKRKENSLEDFYINRFGKPLYGMFFEKYTEKVWGTHPSVLEPDWGSQRVKGVSLAGILKTILLKPFLKNAPVETSLIEQFYYPKLGPGHLYETMAAEIRQLGGQVVLNAPVDAIEVQENRVVAVAYRDGQGNRQRIAADAVFSSMAIKDLIHSFSHDVPSDVRDIALALPYRDFITVGLRVERLLIKNNTPIKTINGIIPDCWIYIQDHDVKMGRLQIFNNWSPYLVPLSEQSVWLGLEYFCNEGDQLWQMTDDEISLFAAAELEKIGFIHQDDVLDAVVVRINKAYPAYSGSYRQFDTVKKYLQAIDGLYCIGRNGQHRYNNMDHSILTAMKAAEAYLNHDKSQADLWSVNCEDDYLETKRN